jgi:hypothetical protein
VLRLHKSLYGLRQAAQEWIKKLASMLVQCGLEVFVATTSLFVVKGIDIKAFLLMYVDTGLIVVHKAADIILVLKIFDICEIGAATSFLGMEITHDRDNKTLLLSQRKYVEEVLQSTGMAECKGKSTPMEVNLELSKEGSDILDAGAHVEALGKLLYLSTCSRPDLTCSMGALARCIAKARAEHSACVMRVSH